MIGGVDTQGSVLRPQPWAGESQLRQSCCCLRGEAPPQTLPKEGTEKLPLFPFYRRGQASLSGVYEAFWLRCVVRVKSKNRPREGFETLPNGFLGDVLADM